MSSTSPSGTNNQMASAPINAAPPSASPRHEETVQSVPPEIVSKSTSLLRRHGAQSRSSRRCSNNWLPMTIFHWLQTNRPIIWRTQQHSRLFWHRNCNRAKQRPAGRPYNERQCSTSVFSKNYMSKLKIQTVLHEQTSYIKLISSLRLEVPCIRNPWHGKIPALPVASAPKFCDKYNRAFMCLFCARVCSNISELSYYNSENTGNFSFRRLHSPRGAPAANVCGSCNQQFMCFHCVVPYEWIYLLHTVATI